MLIFAAEAAAAASLPDGRVFERVTPGYTLGAAPIQLIKGYAVPLGDDALVWGNGVSPTGPVGSGVDAVYLARRGLFGWESSSLLPADVSGAEEYRLVGANTDLSASVWTTGNTTFEPPAPGIPRPPFSLRYRDDSGDYTSIVEGTEETYGYPLLAGLTEDGHSVVFASAEPPIGGSNPGGLSRVWRWHPDGSFEELGAEPGSPIADCAAVTAGEYESRRENAVSEDAATVFMESRPTPEGGGCPTESQVYVDDHGQTTLVSEPEGGPEEGQPYAIFRGATPDGRTAYVETAAVLTAEDQDPGASNLYRWSAPSGSGEAELRCLTCAGAGESSQSIPNHTFIAPDGPYFYFVKSAEEPGSPSEQALYVDDGEAVRRVFGAGPGREIGQFLGDASNSRGDVFLFSPFETAAVYRVAIGPGAPQVAPLARRSDGSVGHAETEGLFQASGIRGEGAEVVSEDGRTIAFTSKDALAPGASEITEFDGFTNVYRWHDGEVTFLGRGTAGFGVATTPDAHDIYFQSRDELVPNEEGSAESIYDARVGGGFPPPPATATPCTSAIGCRGPAGTAPSIASPSSSNGAGNPIRKVLILRKVGAAALRRAVRTGQLGLEVKAGGEGMLRAAAQAKIGRHRKTVASTRHVVGGGVRELTLRLKLDRRATAVLAGSGRLHLRITVRLVGAGSRTQNVVLEGGRR